MKLLAALFVAACTGVHEHPGQLVLLSSIGEACDDTHPCSGGAVCGTCGIGYGQCVVPCAEEGSGAQVGCPDGTFCSAASSGAGEHVCVRLCTDDVSCRTPTLDDQLTCSPGNVAAGSAPSICKVPDGVAAQHTCP